MNQSPDSIENLVEALPGSAPDQYKIGDDEFTVCGNLIAVQIYIRPSVTKSGIHIPHQTQQRDVIDSPAAKVIAMGAEAYRDDGFAKPYCSVGDWILFPRWDAKRLNWDDKAHIAFVKDIHVISVVPDPERVKQSTPIDKF